MLFFMALVSSFSAHHKKPERCWKPMTAQSKKQKIHSLAGPLPLAFTQWCQTWQLFLANRTSTIPSEPYGGYFIEFSAKNWPHMMCNLSIWGPKGTLFEWKTCNLPNSLSMREYFARLEMVHLFLPEHVQTKWQNCQSYNFNSMHSLKPTSQ